MIVIQDELLNLALSVGQIYKYQSVWSLWGLLIFQKKRAIIVALLCIAKVAKQGVVSGTELLLSLLFFVGKNGRVL